MEQALRSQQMDDKRTGHNYLTPALPIFVLIVILFFSAWVRFDGITRQGITGGDSFRYLREAKLWVDGQPPKFAGAFYRPVSYFLHSTSMRILGYNDYSIKILHGFLDIINILLIFFIAARLAENRWVGVMSSLIYAFLPNVIYFARHEMVHVESTTFVLLSIFFFVLFDSQVKKRFKLYFLLFLAGLSSGLAANTHADLAFLAPGYVLVLFIKSFDRQNKKESLKEFLILAFIFTFSFFTPYLLGFLIFGPKTVFQVMLKEFSLVSWYMKDISGSISPPLLFFEILIQSLKFFLKKQFLFTGILLIGVVMIIIYRKVRKENDPIRLYLPLILIFFFAFLYSCFLKSFELGFGRYFMALLPAVIITVTIWYYKIFKQFFGKYSSVSFICLFLAIFLINPKVMPGQVTYKSQYRLIYDSLEKHVNPANKLLIAPVTIYSNDRGFIHDLYFGENATYMVQLPIKKEYSLGVLNGLLQGKNVRYVFLGKRIDRRLLRSDFPFRGSHRLWLCNDKSPYTLKKDLKIIRAYINSKGGRLINKNPFGKIYYLTGDKPAHKKSALVTNGSFEHWKQGSPVGKWKRTRGRVSKSPEATDGAASIRLDPDSNSETRIAWYFGNLFKDGVKLRVRLDAKAGESRKFSFFFTAVVDGKRQVVEPGPVKYTGTGDWMLMVKDVTITPGMKGLRFHLRLLPGAAAPAFVDDLSITVLNEG